MKKYLFILILFSFNIFNYSNAQVLSEVNFEIENSLIDISYYLDPETDKSEYLISLEFSQDAGRTYIKPLALSGDLGLITSTGRKHIYWDVFKDLNELESGNCNFKVKAYNISYIKKREGWENVKWYSLAVTSLAGLTVLYLEIEKDKNFKKYNEATTSKDANMYRSAFDKNNQNIHISISISKISAALTLIGIIGENIYK